MSLQKLYCLPVMLLVMFCFPRFSSAQTSLTPYQGNPVISLGSPGSWDAGWVGFGRTILYDGVYYIFYEASQNFFTNPISIGYATSTDGISFTKYENNPVLEGDGTGFDAYFVAEPVPLIEDSTWILYYNASSVTSSDPGPDIGRATAPNPFGPWTRDENPVLETGNPGEWDSGILVPNSVIHTDSGYIMYYSASTGPPGSFQPAMVGMATSPDGITWTKYDDPTTTDPPYADSDPVLPLGTPGSWDSGYAWECSVLRTTSGWEMYYTGFPDSWTKERIGYATSPNGINWIKYEGNPLLEPTEPWANLFMISSSVILIDSTYFLYYTGMSNFPDAQIGLATTPITTIDEDLGYLDVPSDFSLFQNFPNPFNPSTRITYYLAIEVEVNLKVYDILGREIVEVVNKEQPAGIYNVQFDASSLASGIYMYVIVAGDFVRARKMILLR